MSGKPAARIGDTVAGAVIITGSTSVLIGDQGGGAANIPCPNSGTVGRPVNIALGAKVLGGDAELDFALPGILPVIWQRQYCSHVDFTHQDACGVLGFGWTLPIETRVKQSVDACYLFEPTGRVIRFTPLLPGEVAFSASENLHLRRGGGSPAKKNLDHARWAAIPEEWKRDASYLFASRNSDTIWVFRAITPENSQLRHIVDRLGRRQDYFYDNDGSLIGLGDGLGRQFRLRFAQIHSGRSAAGGWPEDSGRRLIGVDLVKDPITPLSSPRTLVGYQFDTNGDLLAVFDEHKTQVREFAYRNHLLVMHRQTVGPKHSYIYASEVPGARVVAHHNQEGLSYYFDYHDEENAVTVTDSIGRKDVYRYEGEAGLKRLKKHIRADGSILSYQYDVAGRLTASTDALQRTTYWQLDGDGHIIARQDPDGARSSFNWDADGQALVDIVSPSGNKTHLDYDALGRLTQVTTANGATTQYRYPDPQRQPFICHLPDQVIDANGGIVRLSWSPTGQLLSYTDCAERTTYYRYDSRGRLLEVIDPQGARQRLARNALGQLTQAQLADGAILTYRYDAAGRLAEITQPDGTILRLARDLWGRLVGQHSAGTSICIEYDVAGRLIALTNQNGATTRFEHDAMNRVTRQVGLDGRSNHYVYDAAGQLIERRDGNSAMFRRQRFAFDRVGRVTERKVDATEYANAERHRFVFDVDGLLMEAHASSWSEEGLHDLQPLSSIAITRDPFGWPVAETQTLFNEAGIEYEYTSRHRHDALGLRTTTDLPGLGEIAWLMYGAGHVHGVTLNSQPLVDFERDAGHREIERRLASGVIEHRDLDPLGRILHQHYALDTNHDFLVNRRYRYDVLGYLSATVAGPHQTQFTYDRQGHLNTSLEDGLTTTWRFDAAGNRLPDPLPASAPAPWRDWSSHVQANLNNEDFNFLEPDSHVRRQPTQDVLQWLDNRIAHSGGVIYRYDAWGNRIEAQHADGKIWRYRYDGLHRLIGSIKASSSEAAGEPELCIEYRYDVFGRRLAKTIVQSDERESIWHGWDADRLVCRETAKEIRHILYEARSFVPLLAITQRKDAANEADTLLDSRIDAQDAAEVRAALASVPASLRQTLDRAIAAGIRRNLPDTVDSISDPSHGQAMANNELDATPSPSPGGLSTSASIHYYHCDHLGTPIAMTDESGRIVWQAHYDPWGNLLHEHNPQGIEQPVRFQGQFHDIESGLHYNRHRYYDPQLGTYITQDPIGFGGDMNFYRYAFNSPLVHVDRLGLFGDGRYAGPEANPNGPLGHSDLYGQKEFGLDFTKEDHGWSSPFNPLSSGRHFQPLEQSEKEANDAIRSCNKDGFERAMHRVADFYSHYAKGYRWDPFNFSLPCWGFGHICDGTDPDDDPVAWEKANDKSKEMVDKWRACCS